MMDEPLTLEELATREEEPTPDELCATIRRCVEDRVIPDASTCIRLMRRLQSSLTIGQLNAIIASCRLGESAFNEVGKTDAVEQYAAIREHAIIIRRGLRSSRLPLGAAG